MRDPILKHPDGLMVTRQELVRLEYSYQADAFFNSSGDINPERFLSEWLKKGWVVKNMSLNKNDLGWVLMEKIE